MALTVADLSEMAIAFISLFGGFLKKIAPPEVPELWTSFASALAACALIAVKLILAESSSSTVLRYLFPAAFIMLGVAAALCLFHLLTRNSRTVSYDGQLMIAGTEYGAAARTYIEGHPGASRADILLEFGGDTGRVWTDRSLRSSRRILGAGYALSVACLAFAINLSVEAYNAPKESPKFSDLVSKLADVHFDSDKTDLAGC